MPHFTSTDDLGKYEIDDVKPGRYLMQVIPGTDTTFTSGSPAVSPGTAFRSASSCAS